MAERLKVGVLNVNGWTDRNSILREQIIKTSNFDIFCVTETHLLNNNSLHVEGYKWYGHNRQGTHILAPKGSGGVGIFVKEDLLEEYSCNIVDKGFDGIIGILLEHKMSEFRCYLYCCYSSPENSTWGRDSVSFYAHLLSQVYLCSDSADAIVMCGDLNARIGELNDYIVNVDDVTSRQSIDKVVNQHGHAFIDFLQEAKFCVLNGRICPENDNITCCTARGVSVVDYVFVPHDNLEKCSNFSVMSMVDVLSKFDLKYLLNSHCKSPDHALLCFELPGRCEHC